MTQPSPSPQSPIARIPAHILYPGMVVALLSTTIAAQGVLLWAARSDGGAQIEPGYYGLAVEWDARTERLERQEALGWQIDVELLDGDQVEVQARDALGEPLRGLSGRAVLSRPEMAGDGAPQNLREDSKRPGVYLFTRPRGDRAGLWDVRVEVEQAESKEPFMVTKRRDWPEVAR